MTKKQRIKSITSLLDDLDWLKPKGRLSLIRATLGFAFTCGVEEGLDRAFKAMKPKAKP